MYRISEISSQVKQIRLMLAMVLFFSCSGGTAPEAPLKPFPARNDIRPVIEGFRHALQAIEQSMIEQGLVNIHDFDPEIRVELKYSTTDNFLGKDVYQGMKSAYLQPDVAQMLVQAQKQLKSINPELTLVVYDAARPRHIQQKMWDAVDAPFHEKVKFLANPQNGSLHNFGAAVDISILDKKGVPLDMGTQFDHMGELAYPVLEDVMFRQGKLTRTQLENRQLLRSVMRYGGFWGIQTEWWHFNACTRAEARERYKMIE